MPGCRRTLNREASNLVAWAHGGIAAEDSRSTSE